MENLTATLQESAGNDSVRQTIKIYVNVPTQLFSTDLQFPRGVPINGSVSLIVGNFSQSHVEDNYEDIEHLITRQKLVINTPCADGDPLCVPKPCEDEYNPESFRDAVFPTDGTVTLSARHLMDDDDFTDEEERSRSPAPGDCCDDPVSSDDDNNPSGNAPCAPTATSAQTPGYGYLLVSDISSSSSDDSALDEYSGSSSPDQDVEWNKFSCGICGTTFPTRDLCQRHVFQHLPAVKRDHKCSGCNKSFTSGSCRDWHSKSCAGPRFRCHTCSKEFLTAATLKQHARTHGKYVYAYCCEYCGRMTQKKLLYQNHVSEAHREDVVTPAVDVAGLPVADPRNACPRCSFVGDGLVSLSKHSKEHTDAELFPCRFCSLVFVDKAAVDQHRDDVHRIQIEVRESKVYYICRVCGKRLASSVGTYGGHMMKHRHPHVKNFLCSECGAQLCTQKSLLHHMRLHDESERINCPECGQEFPTSYHLQRHITRVHEPNLKHGCPYCARKFLDGKSYKLHLVRIHEGELTEDQRKETEALRKRCEHCSFTTFDSWAYRQHVDSHAGSLAFSCDRCPRAFSYKFRLDQHRAIAHTKEGGRCKLCRRAFFTDVWFRRHVAMHADGSGFTCERCSKMFESRGRLRRHVESVHDTTPGGHACRTCGKTFALPTSLNMHLRVIHGKHYARRRRGEFSCRDCGQTFGFLGSLEAHRVCKHGKEEGNPECTYCSKRCTSETELALHMRSHFNERVYKCKFCDREFLLYRSMKSHEAHHAKEQEFPLQSKQNEHLHNDTLLLGAIVEDYDVLLSQLQEAEG